MISRRNFTAGLAAGTALMASGGPTFAAMAGKGKTPTQKALVFDAMGEIREVYSDSLVEEMIDSGLDAIGVTLCDPKTYEQEAFDVTVEGIQHYDRLIEKKKQYYLKATSLADIDKARKEGRVALFYLTQNTTHYGRDLDRVDLFHSLGQRICQITYNYQNWAGAGCKETNGSGLTVFGHELVQKLNETNTLIDLSHAGMRTMADTIKASKVPVHISHTCCKALNDNPRNTTDENMKALADKGGVVGICQMRPFMTLEKDDALHYYFEHIEHAIKVAGVDHVCIGSDRDHRRLQMTEEYIAELKAEEGANFHAAEWPLYFEELNGPRRMETIWDGLKKRGHSDGALEKVFGTNLYRLYGEVVG
tara:strand:+ start:104 stop:1192 length:1089 start_codon:yes stop_codon:yes gene_type:complete